MVIFNKYPLRGTNHLYMTALSIHLEDPEYLIRTGGLAQEVESLPQHTITRHSKRQERKHNVKIQNIYQDQMQI
jgi:hypothetical protein